MAFPISGSATSTNSYVLCEGFDLSSANHTLQVVPSFASSNSVFWLDQIQYAPISSENLVDVVLQIQSNNTDVAYRGNWNDYLGFAQSTGAVGSSCSLKFNGEHIYDTECPSK
jgi:hypothetical protein